MAKTSRSVKFSKATIDFENMKIDVESESTADLPSEEFEYLMEELRRWAYEFLKVTIPLPNELEVLNF